MRSVMKRHGACGVLGAGASFIVCAATLADATIVYVDADATGSNNGFSWTDAFPSLGDCLDAIAGATNPPEDGWQIWVAEGTYVPNFDALTFPIQDLVFVYGGFVGTETTRTQRDPEANETVLSGEFPNVSNGPCGDPEAGSCFEPHEEGGCDRALCCEAVCSFNPLCCSVEWDSDCVEAAELFPQCNIANAPNVVSTLDGGLNRRVDGFTITLGGSFEQTQQSGVVGGGVRITEGSLQLVRCLVTGNRAEDGGGVSIDTDLGDEEIQADGQIWNCRINGNVSTIHGAGVFVLGRATYTIANSEIAANTSIWEPTPPNPFQLGLGGGLFEAVVEDGYSRQIVNSTIVRNLASLGSQGVYQNQFVELHDEDLAVFNSIVRNNYVQINVITGLFEECPEPCEDPEIVGGAQVVGCLVAFDELSPPGNFTDCVNDVPGLMDIDGGDYRPDTGSACIDAGRTDLVLADVHDVNDNGVFAEEIAPELRLHRRVQPAPGAGVAEVDIGAHEFPNCDCAVGDFNDDDHVDGGDLGTLLSAWGPCSSPCAPDLNGDGEVDGADLGVFLSGWCGDADYPRDCGDSLLGGGPSVTLDDLAEAAGFASRHAFLGWLEQLSQEEAESWIGLLTE